MKPLGIAVIGTGMVANVHVAALKEIAQADIRGVWSRNSDHRVAFASKHSILEFASYEAVLADASVEAVINCLPPGYHTEYGLKAAAAGKHMLVEKPIDVSLEAAKRLIEAYRAQKLTLAVVFQNRFTKAAQKVKAAVDSGLLGRLIQGDAYVKWYRAPSYYQANSWKGTLKIEGGGALMTQAIHTIDLLQWIMGPVHSIAGRVRTAVHTIESEDLAVAAVEWKNGAIGVIEGGTALWPGVKEKIEIHGEKGSITLEGGNITAWKVEGQVEADHVDAVKVSFGETNSPAISFVNHQAQIEDFIRAVREGVEPAVTGEEGLKALAIVLGVYQSAKQDTTVFPVV